MITSFSEIETFLHKVDTTFPTPLSKKQSLSDLAGKLYERGTVFAEQTDGKIVAMAAGYTNNLVENRAYISVVATLPEYRGRGLATKLVSKFLESCREKGIDAVHLYTDFQNTAAIRVYKKLGFEIWDITDEPRPTDAHLIYRIRKEI